MFLESVLNTLNMVVGPVEIFYSDLKNVSSQKIVFVHTFRGWFWSQISQKVVFFSFSENIFWSTGMYRMTLILFRAERHVLGDCFKYLGHGCWTRRKFFTATWKVFYLTESRHFSHILTLILESNFPKTRFFLAFPRIFSDLCVVWP